MSETNSNTSGGVNILGLLGVAFVVLKLTHVINWSWWWVTVPFWGGLVIVLGMVAIALCGAGLAAFLGSRRRYR